MPEMTAEQKAALKKWKEVMREISKVTTQNKPMLAGAFVLQRFSMHEAPVKVGFLRSSHGSVGTDEGAEMQVYAEYAHYVHFGTSKMPANRWITRAGDEHLPEIAEAVKNEAAKEIRKAAQS